MSKKLMNGLLALGLVLLLAVYVLLIETRWCHVLGVKSIENPKAESDAPGYNVENIIYRTIFTGDKETSSEPPGPSQKVVILTYMRSGSTLTGNILQQSPDVLYVYEPLWFTSRILSGVSPRNITLTDNSTYMLPDEEIAMKLEKAHILKAYLDCRFGDVSKEFLSQWTTSMSFTTYDFFICSKKDNHTLASMRKCLQPLVKTCLQKKMTVVKTIRASMQEMFSLMTSDDRVKVIHLLRDPRAALRSKSLMGMFKWTDIRNASREACTRVWEDLQMSRVLRTHFAGRSLTVRYEDIVASPVLASKQIYAFLGLRFTKDIEHFVINSTYGGLPDNCVICSTRTNATATAYKWRTEVLKFPQVLTAQEECAHVMRSLGYRSFATAQEMADMQLQATLEDYGVSDMLRVDVRNENFGTTALPYSGTGWVISETPLGRG